MKKIVLAVFLIIVLGNLYYFVENSIYVKDKDLHGTYFPKEKNCIKCQDMKIEVNSTHISIACQNENMYPKSVKYTRKWNNLYYDTDKMMDDFLILPRKVDVTYDWYDGNVDLLLRGRDDFCIAEKNI